jgi:hypothetical protein
MLAFESEEDENRRGWVAEVYAALTGLDIEERLAILRD